MWEEEPGFCSVLPFVAPALSSLVAQFLCFSCSRFDNIVTNSVCKTE